MLQKIIFFLFFLCCLLTSITYSQWQSDVRLTNDGANSYTSKSGLAINGNVLHIVWQDNRHANTEIYYKRSPDGGISWGVDTRLTNNSAASELPSVCVEGSTFH